MKVAVIGLGKAGLPLASVIADAGIDVVGIDIDSKRCEDINNGINPIPEEPELNDLIPKLGGSKLICSTNYEDAKECSAYIVIVPLFINEDKVPDLSIIRNAMENVSKVLDNGDLVVLETTVPPKTTETFVKGLLDECGKNYYLAYSPERIMTGYSVSRYREFPKVVGGINKESGEKAYSLYQLFCKKVDLVSNSRTAEMIKVSEGVYRDANIAIANELYKVSEELNVDFYEVREYANHQYCNIHLPGNVGGHCIPVYPWFLINDFEVPVIEKAREVNDEMIVYYANKLKVKEGKVLVLGLTYRENVKELAYTRSIPMIKLLKDRGYEVFVNDPMYSKEEIEELGYNYSDDFNVDGIILMNKCFVEELLSIKEKVVDVKGALK
jgi:UDP-N-acetyl-D-mannosaminuronic acid dehydrogenase